MNAKRLINLIKLIQAKTNNEDVEISFYDDSQDEFIDLSEIYWHGKSLPIEESIEQIIVDRGPQAGKAAHIPIGPKIK
jgi:hypothetical protein